jgi:hypothetical protein
MQQPTRLISTPFAQEGDKTEIQNVTGEFDNSATYRLGFPPLTMQSIRLGGKPPKGTDFNGVLFDITENISFLCKGGRYQYNAGLSTLIGGYPEGSNLLLDDNVTEVVSTVAGNQNNPNTDMTGWILKPNKTTAVNVADASGETQQQVNYNGGSKWHSRIGGYLENERVVLANGDIVKSTIDGNTNDPNVDMTGWANFEENTRNIKYANYRDIRTLSIAPSDTDQTTAVIDALSTLSASGVRDTIYIPKGVKFSAKTVFANLPVGIVLKISDFTNFGQGSYKNKFDITFSNDLVDDDTQTIQGSSHHTALTLLNTGTGGTVSASERLASILHSVGISENGDPITAQIMQFRKAGDTDERWAWTLRALISYKIAMKDPVLWVSGKSYAAEDMCLADGGKVYVTALGGTAGSTEPTGTGTGIDDGGVIWDYFAARKSKDATTFIHYEDGNTQISGSDAEISFTILNGTNRGRFYVTNTGDVVLRDQTRGRNIVTSSEARGIYSDGVSSLRFANISGATPTLALSGARVVNAAAVTMTALSLPTGQTNGICYLHFADANTTLQHGSAFQLKGGVNVTPPINGFMTFVRNSPI